MKPFAATLSKLVFLLFLCSSFTIAALNPDNSKTQLSIKQNTYQKLVLVNTLSLTDLKVLKSNTQKGFFTELTVPAYGSANEVGKPKLPVLKNLIEIPVGATIKINIINSSYTDVKISDLGLPFPLFPAQPPLSKSDDPTKAVFRYDAATYAINQFITHDLATVETLGTMRGVNMGRLDISPVIYDPVKNVVRVYTSIEIEIVFDNADAFTTVQQKEKFYSPYFQPSFEKIINYKQLPNKSNFTKYPVKYVIVSDSMFRNTLQPFVQWKTKKGFTVVEAYTSNPAVGNTTTSIKAYLQGLYNAATPSDPAPSFVLFVGDVAQVPAFAGTTATHVTDLYYCEYTGDFLPEVYYGRFSANNISELRPQVDKTLEYEQYLMPKKTFLDTCVMIAGQDPTNGPVFGDGQINYGTETYFNAAHSIYSDTYLYAISGSSAAQIIQNVSNGVCMANYTAHGSPDGWASPGFSISDIATLNNAHKYPLMIGNCCLTSKFDDSICFGEALLRANGKGAIGYIGGSNSTYWDEDYYWGCGYKSGIPLHPVYSATTMGSYDRTFHDHGELWGDWYITQGQMVNAGNLAVTQSGSGMTSYYWEIYHLMGDPSLMIYYSVPDPMTVTYNALLPLGSTTFNITTDAPYSYAAVSKGGVLYGAALADSLGNVELTLNPITIPGTADVVVTCQNRQPYIGTLVVASPTGPYVLYNKNHINNSLGGDTLVDYNETDALDVTLKNYGATDANVVNATISCTDPYLTITDNTQAWGTITSNSFATQTSAYAFTTANFVPDQHVANFTMTIQDNSSDTWNSNFSLKINAPALDIGNFVVDDASGNNNNAIDPGENSNIVIQSLNNGHSDALSTTGTLTTTSPYITITNGVFNFNTLAKTSSANATFAITVSSSLPDTASVEFVYTLQSGAYTKTNHYLLTVGQAMEDFETGNFAKFDWQSGGDTPWIITNVNPYAGIYSAKSGVITDNQSSQLYISMNVTVNDSISFWKKVSCEQGALIGTSYSWYDNMQFQIDGAIIGQWDGENSIFTESKYPVTTGNHTFKWLYVKDGSVSAGDDCAYLDNIIFPPSVKINASVQDNTDIKSSFSCTPNPTKGFSQISFTITKPSELSLKLYDMSGKLIETLFDNQQKPEGTYNLLVNMAKFSAGIYYISLTTATEKCTQKIVVIK